VSEKKTITTAGEYDRDNDTSPMLCRLAEELLDVFVCEVLPRIDDSDRAMLAETSRALRAALASSANSTQPTLSQLAKKLPDVFAHEVLRRLNPRTRAMLAETSRALRTAVAAAGLPRVLGKRKLKLKLRYYANSIERLAWAKAHGCPWSDQICARLAMLGNLKAFRWAREHGCPWDNKTCVNAAEGGHLRLLRWARKHGCPWDKWDWEVTF
jgi:hypothetical protein